VAFNYKTLDFEIIKEPWNKYEIIDGSILKTRFILKKVVVQPLGKNKSTFQIDGQTVTTIFGSPELKGTPSTQAYSNQELKNSITQDGLGYNTLGEEWNEYILEDATKIRVKTTVTKISRTNKYEKTGDPLYFVTTSIIMQVTKPKKYNPPK